MEMPRGNLEQCELPLFVVNRLADLVGGVQRRWATSDVLDAGRRLLPAGGWADVFEQMVRARINSTLLLDLFGYDCARALSTSSSSGSGRPASRERSLLISRVIAELVADLAGATHTSVHI